jgi:hypothetical protein
MLACGITEKSLGFPTAVAVQLLGGARAPSVELGVPS